MMPNRSKYFLLALGLLCSACGPKRYGPNDASNLALEHAKGPDRVAVLSQALACDTMRNGPACAEVALVMEKAGEKNDAISLFDHACELGHSSACHESLRLRGGGKPGTGATTTTTGATPSANCPPEGTETPFGKVVNADFARDFQSCQLRTRVTFWSASGNPAVTRLVEDAASMGFQVSDPAVGEGSFVHVKLPKNVSDPVFSAKKGDTLILTGAPATHPQLLNMFYFVATKVEKAP
jgi:TPR repeat protein